MKQSALTVATDDGPMDVHLFTPPRGTRRKRQAVLVFQEAFGVNGHIRRVCERLAGEGYAVAAPELYHRAGRGLQFGYDEFDKVRPIMAQLTNARLLVDARAGYEALAAQAEVDPRQIAVLGFCLGGFVAALAACHLRAATAVSFYGGGMMRARPGFGLTPLLEDFSGLACPALFVFGDQDPGIPATDIAVLGGRLTALAKPHEIVVYPGAGHGFFCDERAAYHAAAAKQAWDKMLHWFDSFLTLPLVP
jgi:carboxymethylenebutenolidase